MSAKSIKVGDLVQIVSCPVAYPMYGDDLHMLGVGVVVEIIEEEAWLPPFDDVVESGVQRIKMCQVFWSKIGHARWEFPEDLDVVGGSSE